MIKKARILILLCLFSIYGYSQSIKIKNNIVYLDGQEYVKIEKKERREYIVSNVHNNEKILEIKLFKAYNSKYRKTLWLPNILFIRLNESMDFEENIGNKRDLVKLLLKGNLILKNGEPNEEIILNYSKYIDEWRKQNELKNKN